MEELIVELINNEVNAQRVINKLKLSAINNNTTDTIERIQNAELRGYDHTYETAIKDLAWMVNEYEGKELRKQLQQWSVALHKDGKRKLLSRANSFNKHSEGRAYMHFSKSIIEAFKRLPR